MSHHNITPGGMLKDGVEAGLAFHALDRANKGVYIGDEALPVRVSRTAGNLVAAYWLLHLIGIPYLIVTGVLSLAPNVVLAVLGHYAAAHWLHSPKPDNLAGLGFMLGLPLTAIALKFLWGKFFRAIRGVDRFLSGRHPETGQPLGRETVIEAMPPTSRLTAPGDPWAGSRFVRSHRTWGPPPTRQP